MRPVDELHDGHEIQNLGSSCMVSSGGTVSYPQTNHNDDHHHEQMEEITMQEHPHHPHHPALHPSSHQVPSGSRSQEWTSNENETSDSLCYIYEMSLYGCRRLFLYLILTVILVFVVLNAVLTVWILTIINFTSEGMGKLKIYPGGLKLDGDAFLLKDVYANTIRAPKGQFLRVYSDKGIVINSRRNNGQIADRLQLDSSLASAFTKQILFRSPDGKVLLLLDENNILLITERLRINSPNGIHINGSIQAPLIESVSNQELKLESLTRMAQVLGPKKVFVDSKSGDILVKSLKKLRINSKTKSIQINSSKIDFLQLRTALPTRRGNTYPDVYQLCSCQNGRLFMSPPRGPCIYRFDICGSQQLRDGKVSKTF